MPPTNNDIEISNEVPTEVTPALDSVVVDFEVDYENVRANLTESIEIGREALVDLANFAKQAQSAKVYETLGKVLSAFADANQKLIQIHETRKKMRGKVQPVNHNHNNLIVTTADLLKIVKKAINE